MTVKKIDEQEAKELILAGYRSGKPARLILNEQGSENFETMEGAFHELFIETMQVDQTSAAGLFNYFFA